MIAVYVVTRFASQANRRIVQLLSLKNKLTKIVLVHQTTGGNYEDSGSLSVDQKLRLTGIFRLLRLKKLELFADKYLYFPSPAVLYTVPAQKKLEREFRNDVKKHRRICLVTCVPPHEVVLIGLNLKKKFPELCWIIDWQDLWTYDEYYFNRIPRGKKEYVRQLEKEALRSADRNIVTNSFAQDVLVSHYGMRRNKIEIIPHAFDPGELDQNCLRSNEESPRASSVKIGFLGGLFKPPKVPGEKALHALKHVRESGIDLIFHIFGDLYLEKVSRQPVQGLDWVVVHPPMKHEESLKKISACDFLLLVLSDLPNTQIILHAKLPYYLLLGLPILAIVPDRSAAAAVIRETGAGYVIPSQDDWSSALIRILKDHSNQNISLRRNEEAIARYSWEHISKLWLRIFNEPRVPIPVLS